MRPAIRAWIDANPKPDRDNYPKGHDGHNEYRSAKKLWRDDIQQQRRALNIERDNVIRGVLATAEEAVLDAALRALPGEAKRDLAIEELLKALDRAATFPPGIVGKLAEMGSDWFIYHPLRHWVEDAVDRAYAKLKAAGKV